jgi:hypothetical protein
MPMMLVVVTHDADGIKNYLLPVFAKIHCSKIKKKL